MRKLGIVVVLVGLGMLAGCQQDEGDIATSQSAIAGEPHCTGTLPQRQTYNGQGLKAVEVVVMFPSPEAAGRTWAFGVNVTTKTTVYWFDLDRKLVGTFTNGVVVADPLQLAILGIIRPPVPPKPGPIWDVYMVAFVTDAAIQLSGVSDLASATAYQCK